MIKFTQLLPLSHIRQGVICSSKKRVLEAIGRQIAELFAQDELDQVQCFECLFNREKLGNTALGNGVALPRAKSAHIQEPIAVFFQLADPIDYEAADNREVDLILAILIPEQLCSSYTQTLSDIAQRLSDKSFCKQLRAAKSAEEIWQIFEHKDNCADTVVTPQEQ